MSYRRPQRVATYVSRGEVVLEVADQMGEEAIAVLTPDAARELGEALIRAAKEAMV